MTYNVQASPTPVSRLKSPHSLHLGETQPFITITHPDRRSSTASSVLPTRPSPFPSSITVSEAKISVEFLQPTPKGRVHVVASPREQEDPTPTSSAPPFYGLHASCSLFWAYRSFEKGVPERAGKRKYPASSAFASILRVVVEISAVHMVVFGVLNIRLRNHGPLEFLYGKFCIKSCISIISSDFLVFRVRRVQVFWRSQHRNYPTHGF